MDNMPNLENLTREQIEKLKGATSVDELLALAEDEDIEFTSEQLEFMSGGELETYDIGA